MCISCVFFFFGFSDRKLKFSRIMIGRVPGGVGRTGLVRLKQVRRVCPGASF